MKYENLSLISTNLTWQEIVLNYETMEQLDKIKKMLLMHTQQLKTKGHIILFCGTDTKTKINIAALLGKEVNKPVYNINLATLSSTYIGETEKNIEMVFEEAQKVGAILFFDEADALFGKRTEVKDAHDKFANLEVSYLLQKIDDCSSIIILSTNTKDNIDIAFTRRFDAVIYFSKIK
jgi:SpoVK/Ycf46/Vps4 family AAA+-type ATPase